LDLQGFAGFAQARPGLLQVFVLADGLAVAASRTSLWFESFLIDNHFP
jgi:hypothetical protein